MQQKHKDVFDEASLKDEFVKELYKIVRNKTKKLDQIAKLEEKSKATGGSLSKDEKDKLQTKANLQLSLDENISTFQLYKKQLVNKENATAASQPTEATAGTKDANIGAEVSTREQNTQKNTNLQSENKVVECSILTDKQTPETATKETQSTLPRATEKDDSAKRTTESSQQEHR